MFLTALGVLLFLVSCQKRQCWTCTTHGKQLDGSVDTTQWGVCDKTQKEIKVYEGGIGREDSEFGRSRFVTGEVIYKSCN